MYQAPQAKKQVLVLVTFNLVTDVKKAQEMILDQIPCIHFLVQFQKDKKATIQALIDSDSKGNAIILAYAK